DDREPADPCLAHRLLDVSDSVAGTAGLKLLGHRIRHVQLVQWPGFEQRRHADVTIGDDTRDAARAVTAAHGQASAIVIPHQLRSLGESVVRTARAHLLRHDLFYTHGISPEEDLALRTQPGTPGD